MSGAIDLAHPAHNTYREKSDNANIYVRSYLTSKERAN